MVYQLTKFHVQRVDMVINPPWNLPFLGAKGLTSPEQTATGKGISNPLMAVMVCQKPYGIQLTNVSSTERVNTPGSDENRLKLYDLILGDDASKQGRIDIGDINTDAEITLIDETQGRINDIINSNSYLRDILGDILGKDMYYPFTLQDVSNDEENKAKENKADAEVTEKQAGNVQTSLTLSSAELEIQSMLDVPIHQEDPTV
ncbi:hypothetical protein Tco_1038292 [Tanacetum coccineum]